MALKKCKECSHKISTKADKCPNCGVANPAKKTVSKFWIGLFNISVIIFFLYLFFGGDGDNPEADADKLGADAFSTLSLNVRSGPSTEHDVITTLEKGEQVKFLSDSLGWINIELIERDDKSTGWASSKYLSDISEYSSFQDEQKRESRQTTWNEEVDKISAYIMIQEFVKDRLTSPSSADFPGVWDGFDHDQNINYLGDQTYEVRSYVDSENAFGASLRTQFNGKIQQTNEDKWQLLELDVW